MLRQICPIMPSADFDATVAFYESFGFLTGYNDGNYLIVNRDDVEIHFFHKPGHRPEQSDHGAYIRPDDVGAVSRELSALGLPQSGAFPKFAPAEEKPWGMREAVLWDPDGNLLRIGEEIESDG